MGKLSDTLAERLEAGANALAAFAGSLSDAEWNAKVPKDGRAVGVVVHHVASVYPVEIQLAQTLASGKPVTGVDWSGIHQMNAGHAREHAAAGLEATLELLAQNSAAAAAAIRALSD
ncbi:MAG TPA: maleylpyruvate isomerase N-terminal domain-containing protein, partial [Vicinamibacteria bacterium]|nr:maleylpyruvate isomerase N-terminal domain-containing protein [Vicinamibacteria bacterium]